MKLYRALSRVFPRSYRAKLLGVVLCCTFLPMLALVIWLLANNGRSPELMILGVSVGLAAALVGSVLSMVLIFHLLEPLRRAADTLDAYYENNYFYGPKPNNAYPPERVLDADMRDLSANVAELRGRKAAEFVDTWPLRELEKEGFFAWAKN